MKLRDIWVKIHECVITAKCARLAQNGWELVDLLWKLTRTINDYYNEHSRDQKIVTVIIHYIHFTPKSYFCSCFMNFGTYTVPMQPLHTYGSLYKKTLWLTLVFYCEIKNSDRKKSQLACPWYKIDVLWNDLFLFCFGFFLKILEV